MNPRKALSMARKEGLRKVRGPATFCLVFFSPVFFLVVLAYSMAADIKNVPIAIWDDDNTDLARRYMQTIASSTDLTVLAYIDSLAGSQELL